MIPKMQQMLPHYPVYPAWTRIPKLMYAIRCLSRNEAKITQVMRGALHRAIEGTEDWYRVGVQLQGRPPAFLNICNQAGFCVTVLVLVHKRWDSVTFYVLGPGAL